MARRILWTFIAVGVFGPIWIWAQSGTAPVEGPWLLQEYSYAKPAPVRIDKPMGVLFFSGSRYAYVMVRDTTTPRPEVGPEGANATAEQLRATWGPLQAQAGTFEIAGNKLTTRATVAKSPANTTTGAFLEYSFTVTGDTLTMVNIGPSQNPRTWRFVRAK